MATIRLIPSAYSVDNNLSVANSDNMYSNTDSDQFATITNNLNGTSNLYLYLKGFNFSSVPSNAIVRSFTIKLKASETGVSTSNSYSPKLVNNTTQLTSSCSAINTTATVLTFSGYNLDWDDIVGYGSDFGIRINCRRASRNTTGFMYVYGAEIEVDYSFPRTITTTLSGNGTISPSGSNTYYDGDEVTVTIEPTNASDTVTATKDGSSITLTEHSGGTDTRVLGEYNLVSGSFNGSGASYFEGIVGNGVDASATTSNYYSGGSNSTAVFTYDMSYDLPSDAVITGLYVDVSGHAESTNQSNEYMCVQLKSGSTNLSAQYNFKDAGSTSTSTYRLQATTLPTVAQLQNMVLECTLGYYGGAINGATFYLTYTCDKFYTYTFTVSGNSTIAVVIMGGGSQLLLKVNGSWETVRQIYQKVNGAWSLLQVDDVPDDVVWLKRN